MEPATLKIAARWYGHVEMNETLEVDGYSDGVMGIHEHADDGWVVMHLSSGFAACTVATQADAEELARLIRPHLLRRGSWGINPVGPLGSSKRTFMRKLIENWRAQHGYEPLQAHVGLRKLAEERGLPAYR